MENTVVVGGEVKGDISNCGFKVGALTTSRPNIWTYKQTTLAVNNCSGEGQEAYRMMSEVHYRECPKCKGIGITLKGK